MSISLDMNKQQVCNRLGKPSVFRGAIRNKYNQNIEVWEYRVDKGKTGTQIGYELAATALSFGFCAPILLSDGDVETYWLYFYQGKLVRWGQAGDWKREADVIYDINFDNQPRVSAPQGLF